MRTTNHRRGIWAEHTALVWLLLKGYWPVVTRYKTPVGEVDIIVRRGKTLVFVEVKARADVGDAAYAIHHKNQSRVMRAAQHFLVNHPIYQNYQVRFDAVLVPWYKWPQHLANAFGE